MNYYHKVNGKTTEGEKKELNDAEKKLLAEAIGSINNTIEQLQNRIISDPEMEKKIKEEIRLKIELEDFDVRIKENKRLIEENKTLYEANKEIFEEYSGKSRKGQELKTEIEECIETEKKYAEIEKDNKNISAENANINKKIASRQQKLIEEKKEEIKNANKRANKINGIIEKFMSKINNAKGKDITAIMKNAKNELATYGVSINVGKYKKDDKDLAKSQLDGARMEIISGYAELSDEDFISTYLPDIKQDKEIIKLESGKKELKKIDTVERNANKAKIAGLKALLEYDKNIDTIIENCAIMGYKVENPENINNYDTINVALEAKHVAKKAEHNLALRALGYEIREEEEKPKTKQEEIQGKINELKKQREEAVKKAIEVKKKQLKAENEKIEEIKNAVEAINARTDLDDTAKLEEIKKIDGIASLNLQEITLENINEKLSKRKEENNDLLNSKKTPEVDFIKKYIDSEEFKAVKVIDEKIKVQEEELSKVNKGQEQSNRGPVTLNTSRETSETGKSVVPVKHNNEDILNDKNYKYYAEAYKYCTGTTLDVSTVKKPGFWYKMVHRKEIAEMAKKVVAEEGLTDKKTIKKYVKENKGKLATLVKAGVNLDIVQRAFVDKKRENEINAEVENQFQRLIKKSVNNVQPNHDRTQSRKRDTSDRGDK